MPSQYPSTNKINTRGGRIIGRSKLPQFPDGTPNDQNLFTPTITSSAGTITTVAADGDFFLNPILPADPHYTFTAAYLVYFNLYFTITTNGTGSGKIETTLPYLYLPDGVTQNLIYNVSASYSSLSGIVDNGTTVSSLAVVGGLDIFSIFKYDGTYPGADSTNFNITGCYEGYTTL